MSRIEIIKLSIFGAIAILLLILVVTMFSRNKNTDNNYKELVAAKDSLIKSEREKINIYELLIEEKQRTFEALNSRDSILVVHYNETEKLYKELNAKIKDIPKRINAISGNNDSLRSLLATY